MPDSRDFKCISVSPEAITVRYVPTQQTFVFARVGTMLSLGPPSVAGRPDRHPAWLICWLARDVAQRMIHSDGLHEGKIAEPYVTPGDPGNIKDALEPGS